MQRIGNCRTACPVRGFAGRGEWLLIMHDCIYLCISCIWAKIKKHILTQTQSWIFNQKLHEEEVFKSIETQQNKSFYFDYKNQLSRLSSQGYYESFCALHLVEILFYCSWNLVQIQNHWWAELFFYQKSIKDNFHLYNVKMSLYAGV